MPFHALSHRSAAMDFPVPDHTARRDTAVSTASSASSDRTV